MRRKSRLNSYQQKKTQKTIILSILGIIIVLFILFKFGIATLINFSLFLSGNKSSQNENLNQNEIAFVSAPLLNPLPTATNSGQIIISGTALKNSTVDLFINSKLIDNIDVDEKGEFSLTESLYKGNNIIEAKTVYKTKKSGLSNQLIVNFINTHPNLTLNSPTDGASFHREDKSVIVQGETDSNVSVTVNGFFAVLNENNNFSYNLPLHDGDNDIKIIATDQAGNSTEKNIKVNYSQ